MLDAVFQRALEDILARVVVSDRIASRTAFRIAVAFSGGLDSTVLLHLAATACKQRGVELFAFHVHHGLSPNADDWLAHCEEQARHADATFVARQVQINSHDKLGIEQAARLARYDALADMCTSNDVSLLLTAHHQDDQAETVVLQLLRGAGLPGLSAMAMLQSEHALLGAGIALGRPLLEMTRADLELWADTHAIKHIVDESNDDLRFRRNEVRHQLMPLLEQQLPGVQKSIARSARHLQTAQRLLDELAAMDLQSCADADALVIERLRQLSHDRLDNLLRYWLRQCGADQYPRMRILCCRCVVSSWSATPAICLRHTPNRNRKIYPQRYSCTGRANQRSPYRRGRAGWYSKRLSARDWTAYSSCRGHCGCALAAVVNVSSSIPNDPRGHSRTCFRSPMCRRVSVFGCPCCISVMN